MLVCREKSMYISYNKKYDIQQRTRFILTLKESWALPSQILLLNLWFKFRHKSTLSSFSNFQNNQMLIQTENLSGYYSVPDFQFG